MRKALISGAGIAGSTAAYWLAKNGFQVTVVEQARGTRSSGSPVDVRGPAKNVAERMGVMSQIREASTQVRDMVFVNARGPVMSRVAMGAWAETGDVELPRGDLASVLRAAVPDEVEFEFGNTVSALD
jgi:2-polyprenyl-6-methoxyphenol hydroxylase-like FAD-dependent oxidoreductase